jgi:hypothetical protein
VFSGVFIGKELDIVGDKGQGKPQWLMYRHAYRALRIYP